jgi:tetratricopeptide (TPR) repeat protein
LKDYKGALQDFDNEIKNSDNEYEKDALLWDKAQFLYNIGKYTDALDLYTQLLSKADSDSVFLLKDRLYLERAQIYQKLGQTDLAQADLNNSESLDSLDDVLDAIPKPTLILNEL